MKYTEVQMCPEIVTDGQEKEQPGCRNPHTFRVIHAAICAVEMEQEEL